MANRRNEPCVAWGQTYRNQSPYVRKRAAQFQEKQPFPRNKSYRLPSCPSPPPPPIPNLQPRSSRVSARPLSRQLFPFPAVVRVYPLGLVNQVSYSAVNLDCIFHEVSSIYSCYSA